MCIVERRQRYVNVLSSSIIFNRFSNSIAVFCNSWHDCSRDDLQNSLCKREEKRDCLLDLFFLMNFSFETFDFWRVMYRRHEDRWSAREWWVRSEISSKKNWFLFNDDKREKKRRSVHSMTNRDWDMLLYVAIFSVICHRWAAKEIDHWENNLCEEKWFTWIFADVPQWSWM